MPQIPEKLQGYLLLIKIMPPSSQVHHKETIKIKKFSPQYGGVFDRIWECIEIMRHFFV